MKKVYYIVFLFLLGVISHAQKIYYKTFEGLVLTEENYLANKKEIEQREDLAGRICEIPIKTEYKEDSIIKHIKFEFIPLAHDKSGKGYDPYGVQRKMIGTYFPIEQFKDEEGSRFSKDYLQGKPTVINFWFIDCPPCIKEIPDLYNLKKEFGDSVNFIAITFEKRKRVNKFIEEKRFFKYFHITDADKEIRNLKIKAYPMTFLLNKFGEVVNVYGDLTFQVAYVEGLLRELL